MTFDEILGKVLNGERGVSCVALSALDGLIIDEWQREGFVPDVSALVAEVAFLLKELTRISAENGLSKVSEFSFGGSDYFVHVLPVEGEYFVLLVTSEITLTGKTRFYLNSIVPELRNTF